MIFMYVASKWENLQGLDRYPQQEIARSYYGP